MSRTARQQGVYEWGCACFGKEDMDSVRVRGLRFAEEAIELMQAIGVDKSQVIDLIEHIYAKEPGEVAQEVGGTSITLLALCHQQGLNAEQCEWNEYHRITTKHGPEYFAARNQAKKDLGFK